MSTEALTIEQAVEGLIQTEEPATEEQNLTEETQPEEAVSEDEEVETEEVDTEESDYEETDDDSESEYEEDADEYEDDEAADEPVQTWTDDTIIPTKVDGVEGTATIAELKRAFAGQGKIQKGMQEAAEAKKQAEAYAQQAQQAAQAYVAMFQQAQQQGFKAPPQEPTRELYEADPFKYMDAKMKFDEEMKEFNQQQMQVRQAAQVAQQQQQAQQAQRLEHEMQLLKERVPEFADPEKAQELQRKLVKTGMESYGYSAEELSGVTDHRALEVLIDAMKWREMQNSKKSVDRKAKKARPVMKPQAKKTVDVNKKEKAQRAALRKSGSLDDALALVLNQN